MNITLPYPPTVNHYWRHYRGRFVISAAGKQYRSAVSDLVCQANYHAGGVLPLAGTLCLTAKVTPPDRRTRDIDNILKALLDALGHAGAYLNDSQIKRLYVDMLEPGIGSVDLTINPMNRAGIAVAGEVDSETGRVSFSAPSPAE